MNAHEKASVRTGIDIVLLDEFQRSLLGGGESFRRRLFHPSERVKAPLERLAGIFAAKEAAFKALGLPRGDWHSVEVKHAPDGRPYLIFSSDFDASRLVSCDVSISHAGGMVVAVVVALLREP